VNPDGRLCVKLVHCGNKSLANPEDQSEKNIFFMPMGLFALAASLAENAVDVEIINSDLEKGRSLREIVDFSRLDAVGLDCHWVNQSLAVLETAEHLKAIKPDVFVFLGGFTASLFAEEILSNYPQIDAIIKGDADHPIVQLCEALRNGEGPGGITPKPIRPRLFDDVPNLVWRNENRQVQVNDFSYVATAEDLEKLDFAAVDLLKSWEHYRKRSIYWTRCAPSNFAPLNLSPLFFLEIGRGCKNHCVFCGGNCKAQRLTSNRQQIVFRSVESVMGTIRKAMSFGFRTFFTDFEFEGSDAWYRELFRTIRQEQLDIHYVYSSWSLASRELVDALSESFERAFIQLSPETADPQLRRINKGARSFYSNDELLKCLDYISTKDNVRVQLYFGYFLAFETRQSVLDTIEFILELILRYPDLLEIAYLPFSTDPGSLLFLRPEKYDVRLEVRNLGDYVEKIRELYVGKEGSWPDMRLFEPESISAEDAAELERKIEMFARLFRGFRKSISYILESTRDTGIIMRFLEGTTASSGPDGPREVKKALLDACGEGVGADPWLIETADRECELQERRRQPEFTAKPSIWLQKRSGTEQPGNQVESFHA
jgi:radical SAM superfamily enzyme YgiQ (UPF0313 family)